MATVQEQPKSPTGSPKRSTQPLPPGTRLPSGKTVVEGYDNTMPVERGKALLGRAVRRRKSKNSLAH